MFYVDKGMGAVAYVKWWIFAWKFFGSNSANEAFDLVMMVHPAAIEHIPLECKEVMDDFNPKYGQEGECLYRPYIGKHIIKIQTHLETRLMTHT